MREKFAQLRDLLDEVIALMDENSPPAATPKGPVDLSRSLFDPGERVWTHSVGGSRPYGIRFFENGTVEGAEGDALWNLRGSSLVIRWPNSGAPDGYWVDECVMSECGTMYHGNNQDGTRIEGRLQALHRAPNGPPGGTDREFKALRSLLETSDWPEATFAFQVADESLESDKRERAEGIANIILPSLKDKKFLDFGCGEGHVAEFASRFASASVGYDPVRSGSLDWESGDRLFLTSDYSEAARRGPFDVILIYDVIDHASDMNEVLSSASDLLAPGGRIFMRCHPWTARHGSHLYRQMNKAFVHLVFNSEELALMGLSPTHNQGLLYPIESYDNAIFRAGLSKSRPQEVDSQDVERFFMENSLVRGRILKNYGMKDWQENAPEPQMSICFVDYVLQKK